LSEHTKKELVTKGISIVDNRMKEEISEVGIFKFTEQFSNPVQTGFYPYITELGTIRYGLVLTSVESLIPGYGHDKALVIDLQAARPGQAYDCNVKDIFIKDQIVVKDISEAMKNLEELAEALPSYDDYVLLNENLKATEPFRIIENYKDGSGIRRLKIEPTWYNEAKKAYNCGEPRKKDNGETILVLTKKPGDKLEHRNKAVYVPKGFKLLKIHLSSYYRPDIDYSASKTQQDKQRMEGQKQQSEIKSGKPGGLCYLTSFLRENNTFPLTLHTNGSDFFLNVAGAKVTYANPLEAKIAMVTDIGLREKDAEAVLADLIPNKKREGMVKISVLGDHTLTLQDETPESNEAGQPTYYGIPWVDQHDCSDGYTKDPTQQGLGVKPDEAQLDGTINHAVQLAQQGQKEIFDTQTIGALAKYTNSGDKIQEYVPNFVSALDKLGKMLFLTYWNTDEFDELFGKDQLPELIELVKNVFNNLGDLVIFLKKQMPNMDINSNDQSKNDI
jgi:hypothetical protein